MVVYTCVCASERQRMCIYVTIACGVELICIITQKSKSVSLKISKFIYNFFLGSNAVIVHYLNSLTGVRVLQTAEMEEKHSVNFLFFISESDGIVHQKTYRYIKRYMKIFSTG